MFLVLKLDIFQLSAKNEFKAFKTQQHYKFGELSSIDPNSSNFQDINVSDRTIVTDF